MTDIYDAGLQAERTELAWRRTSLTLSLGSLLSMRLLPEAFGDPRWFLAGVVGLTVSGGLWVLGRRRCQTALRRLHRQGDRAPMPGGATITFLALVVGLAGLLCVALVVLKWMGP